MMFLRVYIMVFFLYIAFLSIYWGTYYNRGSRLHRLKFLAIIADDRTLSTVPPVIGNTLSRIITSPKIAQYGTWTLQNSTNYQFTNSSQYFSELLHKVYIQDYWAGCVVMPNASSNYLQAIEQSNGTVNSTLFVHCIYQTGVDMLTVQSYVLPVISTISQALMDYAPNAIIQPLIGEIPQNTRAATVRKTLTNPQSANLITGPFVASITDLRPASYAPFMGIIYVGLIYTCVISVQLFNFTAFVHDKLQDKLHKRSYFFYRLGSSHVLYAALGLAFTLVVVAFRLPYNATFGKSGFLVIWAASYLNLAALGGINENILLNVISFDRTYIGFYIVGFLIINISPIMSEVTISPKFYRYSYALPVYNYQKILIICFFDTTKRRLGRYIGILIAWVVVTNIAAPFSMKLSKKNAAKFAKLRET